MTRRGRRLLLAVCLLFGSILAGLIIAIVIVASTHAQLAPAPQLN